MTLAHQDQTAIQAVPPATQVALATAMANALSGIVEDKELFTMIGGKKHLQAEAWQTVVAFDNANPVTEWCNPIRDDENTVIAYEAKVNIVKGGEIIASGIMACGLDEFPCRGQQGYGKHRAAMSSAQTWAGAKAARTKYAWVVTLAGYSGTPAEELPDQTGSQTTAKGKAKASDSNLMCPVHNIEFFKTAKMKGFAHKNEDNTWCNQADVAKAPPVAAPDAAEHYCAEHERRQALDGQGRWYHQIGDQEFWCVAGVGVMNAQGELVPEAGDSEDGGMEI